MRSRHRWARRPIREIVLVGLAAVWLAAATACGTAAKVRPLPLGDPADPAAPEAGTSPAQAELGGAAITATPTATPTEQQPHHHHPAGGGR